MFQIDLAKEGFVKTKKEMDEFCEQKGFAGWFECSAKDNVGIDQAAKFLIQKMLENEHTKPASDPNIITPGAQRGAAAATQPEERTGCCK